MRLDLTHRQRFCLNIGASQRVPEHSSLCSFCDIECTFKTLGRLDLKIDELIEHFLSLLKVGQPEPNIVDALPLPLVLGDAGEKVCPGSILITQGGEGLPSMQVDLH